MIKNLIKKITPTFIISLYHYIVSFLGAVIYGFPSRKIKVIGITGTNGKSTTAELVSLILKEAGHRVALLSSIKFEINNQEKPNLLKMTMPGRAVIQKFLKDAVISGCQYAILEVTSEGIKQHRHRFINFKTAIFTNLSAEHIEAHGGFENYKKAKSNLFKITKNTHIINKDDEYAQFFLKFKSIQKWLYGIENHSLKNNQSVEAQNIKILPNNTSFNVENITFNLKLLGRFNIYNALAAIGVAKSENISLEIARIALEKAKVIPGRMEEVISSPFRVFVDYAFTPNALAKVYQTLKDNFKPNHLICVLGACGGGRDKWKRPVLGEIAKDWCDTIIVTNEDPYDEDPEEIIDQVLKGSGPKARKIIDRREAIQSALKEAQENDVVVLTGKGSEPWICLSNGRKIAWDEKHVVKEELSKIL